MKEKMEVNCAWCGRSIRFVEPPKDWNGEDASHGCCESCRAKQREEQRAERGAYRFRIEN